MEFFGFKKRDDELMRAIGAGEPMAFEKLYNRWEGKIFGFLVRFTAGDQPLAEDIFQQGWIKLVKAAPNYESRGSFESWIFTIFRRTALTEFNRSKGLVFQDEEQLDKSRNVEPEREIAEPIQNLLNMENIDKIKSVIDALPPQQRIVLLSQWLEGLSMEEISKEFNLSLPSVKSLLFRGRQTLRNEINGFEDKKNI